jgi:hypothetical protein
MISDIEVTDVFGRKFRVTSSNTEMGVEVSWKFNGEIKKKRVEDQSKHSLIPCVTSGFGEIVIVFGTLKEVSTCGGAAIFNPDGSIRANLAIPDLVSKQYKLYEKKVGKQKALDSIKFLTPFIRKMDNREEVIAMTIGFDYDKFEIRELNPQTGEFGKCLGVSRL